MAHTTRSPFLIISLLALVTGCSNEGLDSNDNSSNPAAGIAITSSSSTSAGAQNGYLLPVIPDPHQAGAASELLIEELSYGRLVQVFDFDPSTQKRNLVYKDVVIGPDFVLDSTHVTLTDNLAQQSEFTILHKQGSSLFKSWLQQAEDSREPIADLGLPFQNQIWPTVLRNAAISVRFNDLLASSSITKGTVRVSAGMPFEARVFADRNHGGIADPDGDSVLEFYPTRVILDLTVSEVEAFGSNPPLVINNYGLPAATDVMTANVTLRIPTQVAPQLGQNKILKNPAGNGLSTSGNGTAVTDVPTMDILRAFRSGGDTSQVGDSQNGMLADSTNPYIVGELGVSLSSGISAVAGCAHTFLVPTITFDMQSCATDLYSGSLIRQGAMVALVESTAGQTAGVATDVTIRVLHGNSGQPSLGSAIAVTAFVPGIGDDPDCYVSYSPTPTTSPNDGVQPDVQARVSFSEPINLKMLNGFYSMTVSPVATGLVGSGEIVAGELYVSLDGTAVTFSALSSLAHTLGDSESWFLRVGQNPSHPIEDLAGLLLVQPMLSEFRLDRSASTTGSGSIVLNFDSSDMLGNDGFNEMRGQFTLDTMAETMDPRPVSRFEGTIDSNGGLPSIMTHFPFGVQTPLVSLGSKMHQLWRHADLGFNLLDEDYTNLDVEGISWAPVGGAVIADNFDEFSITLGHSKFMPDEFLNPLSGFPNYPNTGIQTTFDDNYLESGSIVHSKEKGYTINPAELYTSSTGVALMPYPMNQSGPVENQTRYTWRDTAIESLGGPNITGVPLDQEYLLSTGSPNGPKVYATDEVPSIGLPLLMEFRCYPGSGSLGLNSLDVSLAANSSPRPNFRAHSSGGFSTSGLAVAVDPDNADVATGGFTQASNPPGAPTPGVDNASYTGAIDFVTLKSRVHSIWFDTGSSSPNYSAAATLSDLPLGTHVQLSYRGADNIAGGTPGQALDIQTDAASLDPYGDPTGTALGTPNFFSGDSSWTNDITTLNGARFLQVRISFISNHVTNEIPDLGGLGISWGE
ncbi:MAG: hypothetical protein ACI8X5_002887 [Planctomycetota bacterium]|jgi:hypothetical protein